MVNWNMFKEANILTSLGMLFLFIYVISVNNGTPLPSWIITLFAFAGLIGTLLFLITKFLGKK